MPPKPIVDPSTVDLSRLVAGPEEIRRRNAQRYEMEHLNGICILDQDAGIIVGFKDVTDDEFWVRGHIPGRPLLPGVIMCEAAAQLCSYYYKEAVPGDRFLGFGGLEGVKFRAEVAPGHRLILAARNLELRPRRATFYCQGFVEGRMVYEGTVIGMPM